MNFKLIAPLLAAVVLSACSAGGYVDAGDGSAHHVAKCPKGTECVSTLKVGAAVTSGSEWDKKLANVPSSGWQPAAKPSLWENPDTIKERISKVDPEALSSGAVLNEKSAVDPKGKTSELTSGLVTNTPSKKSVGASPKEKPKATPKKPDSPKAPKEEDKLSNMPPPALVGKPVSLVPQATASETASKPACDRPPGITNWPC